MAAVQMPDESVRLVHASGACEIDLARRELRVLGSPVPIGGRAFEVIEVLARSAGEIVTKNELMDRIWPGAIVTENTLHVHTMAVRKALGPYRTLLKTESRRGFRLIGDWAVRPHDAANPPVGLQRMRVDGESPVTNFPASVTRLIGRTAALARVRDLMSAYRVVTLTGPGGIGKTSLALKAARGAVGEYAGGGWLVELAPLADPSLVPSAVAGVLGLKLGGGGISADVVARAIGGREILLVVDNCEHVIGATAELVERLVYSCPRVMILATSREVLRINGETVYRVPPLDVPRQDDEKPDIIFGHSAIQLFIARTTELNQEFSPRAEDCPDIAVICRHLDGIPLAIEFAAARVATLGIQQTASHLDDCFALLTSGRRTALPRHQTLRAMLDWSHELLTKAEQAALRRMAVFAGSFSFQAACAVAASTEFTASELVDIVANLVSKSLVVLDAQDGTECYRLLQTTRTYASRKLSESGEQVRTQRRHAEYCRDRLERAGAEAATPPTPEWLTARAAHIGDLRLALGWAFSPSGDTEIGVALTVAALPLWTHLSLNAECRRHVERALSIGATGETRSERRDMQLFAALGAALIYTQDPGQDARDAWTQVVGLAEKLGDKDYQTRALWGLWSDRFNNGAFRVALEIAEKVKHIATVSDDPAISLISDRMVGISLFYLGDHTNARRHLEFVLDRYAILNRSHIIRFQFDQGIVARTALSRIIWALGYPDQARRMVDALIETARAADHAASLCLALSQAACPVMFLTGDLPAAERFIMMLETATKGSKDIWQAWCVCFKGILLVARGLVREGLGVLHDALDELPDEAFHMRYIGAYACMAEAHGRAGEVAAGLTIIERTLVRCQRDEAGWCMPDLLRVKGELLWLHGDPDAAEACLQDSLDVARRQDVLSWQLRTAISLARLRREQGRTGEARDLLVLVSGKFAEGFGTADLQTAARLIDALA